MNKKSKWAYNPFERIAGWQALFLGVAAMALTAVIGKINNIAFSGVLNVKSGATFDFSASFAMQAINFFSLFLTMWLSGVCFSKSKLRVIDVAGTMAFARTPMLLFTIACFLPIAPETNYDIPHMTVFSLVCIPFIIWMVALMYNGYVVSCHLKGSRAIVSFIGALAIAHIASLLIFFFLSGSLFTNAPIKNVFSSESKEYILTIDSLSIRQKTENIVKAFERGDFNAVTVYFDKNMKKKLSPSGLKIGWLNANMTFGKFEKADMNHLKEIRDDKYDVIEVPFFFAKQMGKLRLHFNSEGKISGLFIQPVN